MSDASPQSLGDLRTTPVAPPELEDRVVAELRSRKLINANKGVTTMKVQYAVNAAVAIVSALLGVALGQRMDAMDAPAAAGGQEEYVMLLYEDDTYRKPAPGQMEARIGEYSQWAREVAAMGKYVTGEKLTDEATLLLPGGERLDVIPTAEQGVVEGYFVIRASDLDEAAAIAATCPHLAYGGTVSLRRLAGGR